MAISDFSASESCGARLIYIKEIKSTNLIRLGIIEGDEHSSYTVRASVYSELGRLMRGEIVDEGTLEEIRREDEYIRVKKSALSILSYGDNNEKMLKDKLRTRGANATLAEEIAREMVSVGYIDERKQLERILLTEANVKLYGAGKIIPRLCAKGYSAKVAREVLAALVREGDIDFTVNAKKLIAKKLPDSALPEQKKALLYKQGYKVR